MLLMTPSALEKFESSTGKWSLSAGAGLTVVNYSGNARARTEQILTGSAKNPSADPLRDALLTRVASK